jgi:hypothetical protein
MVKTDFIKQLQTLPKPIVIKGKRIFNLYRNNILISEFSENGFVTVKVPSESSDIVYNVEIDAEDEMADYCNCPAFANYDYCKHQAAALIYLSQMGDSITEAQKSTGQKTATDKVAAIPNDDFVRFQLKSLNHYDMENITNKRVLRSYPYQFFPFSIQITGHNGSVFHSETKLSRQQQHNQELEYLGNDLYRARCTCKKTTEGLCEHLYAVLCSIANKHGFYYFRSFDDYSREKNELLKPYNITVNDEEAKLFTFDFDRWSGKLRLTHVPNYFFSATDTERIRKLSEKFITKESGNGLMVRPPLPPDMILDYEVGILFHFVSKKHIGMEIEPIMVRYKTNGLEVKRININEPTGQARLKPLPDNLYRFVMLFSQEKITQELKSKGLAGHSNYYNTWSPQNDVALNAIRQYMLNQIFQHWDMLADYEHCFVLTDGKFSKNNIKPVKLTPHRVQFGFAVENKERHIVLHMKAKLNGETLNEKEYQWHHSLLLVNDTLAIPEKPNSNQLFKIFDSGKMIFSKEIKTEILRSVLLPLQQQYDVQLPSELQVQEIKAIPTPQLHVSEFGEQYLMLKLFFDYEGNVIEHDSTQFEIIENENTTLYIHRHAEAEKVFKGFIRATHPAFSKQLNNPYFFLPFSEVMKNNWLLNMTRQVQDAGYSIFGIENLKRFRYNTSAPKFEIKAGSGIDWFDLQIEISWGDMKVALKDVRKAILNKQHAVLLGDGTLGLIPEDWLQQFGNLLKMGSEENGSLRVSKKQIGVLDDVAHLFNNAEIQEEIREKKQRLLQIENIKTQPLSKKIKAQLRPYQLSGFQWLQALDELNWGGCLADDMGLGKTLQVIAFLQYLKEKNKGVTSLVICPTSLIYNWQSEIEKFCPALKHHIYYGAERELGESHFEEYDVILTSYSVARNDAEQLRTFIWNYIVLDESHYIKNPDSQTTKALYTLKSKNKIILSGTPVQNNTFDLYSQFHFINPGLLGNREFFKTEFANPIDKNADKDVAAQLRKIVYPFLLRRTKEQVATDLPDKTETILWCEMEREQRSAYESYRKFYRDSLMKKIDEVGMNQAGIYILEALLRMRQLCDHPALVKDKSFEKAPSVKIEELLREINENTGSHKILVFSQFTEMLAHIRAAMEECQIDYCYLDGSVPAMQRKKEVARFQTDDKAKVFLISLKAGGVGLNLTAADYVYMVDPWWNPAAEQQAIDRTHRIGQTKKIFAYKLICKDTVEEKILMLQQRKKDLSNELISEEAGFIKKLTKDDVAFLLS